MENIAAEDALTAARNPKLESMLQSLPSIERKVVDAFYLQQQSLREVAEQLQMVEGTVKSHLHRARKRLADRYQAEDWLG